MSIFGKEKRPVARGWPDPSTAGTAQRDAPAVSDRLSFSFGGVSRRARCPVVPNAIRERSPANSFALFGATEPYCGRSL